MRILFLTQYYPPETGAAQNRLFDLSQRLAGFGHDVTVLTAMPNYPKGEIFESYRGKFFVEEQIEGIRVFRAWIFPTKSKGFLQRLANYFSFVFTAVLVAVWKVRKPQIIVVESPPLFLGLSALVVRGWTGAKLVFNVSDLWPDSAVALGMLHNQKLIDLSAWLERLLYRKSDLVTGQARKIVAEIRGRTNTPVLLYTNGIDPALWGETGSRSEIRKQFGITDHQFVVGYAGLHGLAQGLHTIIDAAQLLVADPNVLFVFWGDGPDKPSLTEAVKAGNLHNVKFFPPQPKASMPSIMNAMDVSLVPLKKMDVFKGVLPNKLFESMGMGVPVIASVDGEPRQLVEEARGGVCVPPEDSVALAEAIRFLSGNPEMMARLGRNGKSYIGTNYDRRVIARRVEKAFKQLLAGGAIASEEIRPDLSSVSPS